MYRPNPIRWWFVGLLAASLPAFAQAPTPRVKENAPVPAAFPASPSSQTPAAVMPASPGDAIQPPVPQQPGQAVSQVQLTPEEEGDALERQQRYQAAIAAYKKIPRPSAGVWNKMGIAYQMLLNLKDALRCYKESIKLDSRNAITMNNMATVYDSLKQYKQAEKTYRKALKIDPQSAIIFKNLGTNLLTQHKYDKGLDAYKQAMALNPQIFQDQGGPRVSNPAKVQDRGAMNYYMALGCMHSGQTECALQYLRNALNEGYISAKKLATDDTFLPLRDNPGFQQLLAEQNEKQPQKPQ